MFIGSLPASLPVRNLLAWCPWRGGEDIRSPESAVTDGCEPTSEYWESNSGPPEEQPVLLNFKPFTPAPTVRSRKVYVLLAFSVFFLRFLK